MGFPEISLYWPKRTGSPVTEVIRQGIFSGLISRASLYPAAVRDCVPGCDLSAASRPFSQLWRSHQKPSQVALTPSLSTLIVAFYESGLEGQADTAEGSSRARQVWGRTRNTRLQAAIPAEPRPAVQRQAQIQPPAHTPEGPFVCALIRVMKAPRGTPESFSSVLKVLCQRLQNFVF